MKKKIIIPISFTILLITLIVINIEKASAGTGMCTFQSVFFYNEAYDVSHTGTGTTVNNTSWDDGSGTSANTGNASYEIRDMTEADCINYVNGEAEKSAAGLGAGTSYVSSGNHHFNTGSYETGLSEEDQMVGFIKDTLGGGSVEAGCRTFTNNTIKPSGLEIKDNGINQETGKPQDQITREIDYDSGEAMTLPNGKTFKFSAQTVVKTWTAPCEVEPEDNECSCGGSGGGGGTNMNTCGGTITNSISGCESGTVPNTANPAHPCGTPVVSWSVKYTITETITVSVLRNPNPIYAGGGIGLKINQNSSTSTSVNGICVKTDYGNYTCDAGDSLSGSTCTHTYRECDTNSITGEESCETKTNTYDATCKVMLSGGDKAAAEAAARSAAASAGGGSTPEKIRVSARKSNDEKDSNLYDLSTDVDGQGIAISSIDNNNETEIEGELTSSSDSMGIGRYMHSSVNKACINRRTAKVRYVTNGDCSDDEVDGGYKYYVPLKYPSSDFVFHLYSGNISSITRSVLNADCPVKVNQKLYGDDGTYKFVYRPVDLLTDPQLTVFPNRNPASNWVNFKNTQNDSRTGQYDLLMKRDKTEYSATLDTSAILNIRNINDSNRSYASLDTISNSGRSNLIDNLGVSRSNNTVYNKLGECNSRRTSTIDGTTSDNTSLITEGTECW